MTHDEHPSSGDLRLAELRVGHPRRDRGHPHRRVHGHAGPAHGQAGHGQRVPGRRHRPRRARLHLSAGHGHGDEHARWLRAHELGDRLRRLHHRSRSGTRCASCRGRTAPRWCWAMSSTRRRTRRCRSRPRTILKRQVAAAADMGMRIKAGSEFEYYLLTDTYEEAAQARASWTSSASGTTTRTTTCSRPPRRSRCTAQLRRLMTQARIPIEFSKGEAAAGPARGQHPLRRGAGVGRPVGDLQARRQGDRVGPGLRPDVHGQARPHLDRLVGPPAHERLGLR